MISPSTRACEEIEKKGRNVPWRNAQWEIIHLGDHRVPTSFSRVKSRKRRGTRVITVKQEIFETPLYHERSWWPTNESGEVIDTGRGDGGESIKSNCRSAEGRNLWRWWSAAITVRFTTFVIVGYYILCTLFLV